MRKRIKHLFLSTITTLVFLGNIQSSFADEITDDANKLLNWAQNTFKDLFPSTQPTQTLEPWLYRYYPETGIYAGVNKNDQDVYVLGGSFGSSPKRIDSLTNLITQIDNSGGNTGIPACDSTKIPAGITASQSGNVVTVTTNNQCIAMPTDTNICQVPQQPAPTNISLLGTNNLNSSDIKGITVNSGPNPFQAIVDAAASVKNCTIHAPVGSENTIVNSDLCFDITSAIEDLGGSIPGVTITPPVTYHIKGTYATQMVADCFKTDASFVNNAVTGEAWAKQNGTFVKIK